MKLLSNLKKQATGFLEQYKQREPAQYAAAQQAIGGLLILDGFIGIDNPFAGNKRSGIFGTIGLMLFGALFMFVPTLFGNITGANKMTAQTNAQVVSVGAPQTTTDSDGDTSTTCGLTVKFTVDGKDYQGPASSNSSSNCNKQVGQNISIDYNPADPSQWMTDRQMMMSFLGIFFFVGLFILLTGVVTFFIRLLSIIFGWKLLMSGRRLAKTLPSGIDMGAMINDIKRDFTKIVFGFNDGAPATPVAQPTAQPTQQQATAPQVANVPRTAPTDTPPKQ